MSAVTTNSIAIEVIHSDFLRRSTGDRGRRGGFQAYPQTMQADLRLPAPSHCVRTSLLPHVGQQSQARSR